MPTCATCPNCSELLFLDAECQTSVACRYCGAAIPALSAAAALGGEESPVTSYVPVAAADREYLAAPTTGAWSPAPRATISKRPAMRVAAPFDRLLGATIDFIAAVVLPILVGLAVAGVAWALGDPEPLLWYAVPMFAIFAAVQVTQWVMLARSGQSIGKRVVGIRIVDDRSGKVPDFFRTVVVRSWLPGFLSAWLPIFFIIDIIFIFGRDARCLHDMMASTLVVLAPSRKAKSR